MNRNQRRSQRAPAGKIENGPLPPEVHRLFLKAVPHHQAKRAFRGLNLHADAAAINVNFWITPNETNRNPESGGLIVWDKEAPDEWDFAEYNNDKNKHKIQKFLKESGAKLINIPHRQNRAVIFNSNLFHETDVIESLALLC